MGLSTTAPTFTVPTSWAYAALVRTGHGGHGGSGLECEEIELGEDKKARRSVAIVGHCRPDRIKVRKK